MVRKCCRRRITEIAVMEMSQLGLKTQTRARTRPLAMTTTATTVVDTTTATAAAVAVAASTHEVVKKRKLNDGELRISAASFIQLSSSQIHLQSSNYGHRTLFENDCSSPSSDHDDRFSISCCSSNGSSQDVNERIKLIDLEDDESVEVETSTYYNCKEERSETSMLRQKSFDLDSSTTTTRPSMEVNSRRRSTVEKMPTESELEEFFSVPEKNLQKQFTDKYNYDIVKDEPIEGRYEWVRLRP